MTNSTSTDVTIGGAWCNRVVAMQEDYHSAAPADQQIMNKDIPNHPRVHCSQFSNNISIQSLESTCGDSCF